MLVIKIEKTDIQVLNNNTLLHSVNINDDFDMRMLNNYLTNSSGGDKLVLNGRYYCKGGDAWHRHGKRISKEQVMTEINKVQ